MIIEIKEVGDTFDFVVDGVHLYIVRETQYRHLWNIVSVRTGAIVSRHNRRSEALNALAEEYIGRNFS
jgi:hypothetical protein